MTGVVLFDPLLPWPLIAVLAALAVLALIVALRYRLRGSWLRLLAAGLILGYLSGPVYQQEDRKPLDDIVVLLRDDSASQRLGERAVMTDAALAELRAELAARPNTELHEVVVGDDPKDGGTRLMGALSQALSDLPRNRIAGAIVLSDGLAHDAERAPDMPAPLHLLHTGKPEDWDRRLVIDTAPAFGILGEELIVSLHIADDGAAPANTRASLDISLNGGPANTFQVPVGRQVSLPLTLDRAGRNVLQISTPAEPGELTDRNNAALLQINGVRDRLRVLLVSGEPYQGERTWRNLLKSDSSVDLVHFTILRPPEKQDNVPVHELSLIAFPTRELFMDKVDDFDLIIFDRYKRRGILPTLYLENIRRYIEDGGAVLIATGADFAGAQSLYRTALRDALPGEPTARVFEQPFRPRVTDLGQRHPVTAGLQKGDEPDWGRWLRQVELKQTGGEVVMTGANDSPLLLLDRVGKGRVAELASDQAWLWHRGYEGGGPQLELLRRLAHWLMKEPELEEEALWADVSGQTMRIMRRSLTDNVGEVTVTTPSGEVQTLSLKETSPGLFEAVYVGDDIGLYRLQNDDLSAVVGVGPAAPREFSETIASEALLAKSLEASGGSAKALIDGVPRLRDVRPSARAWGRGWIGLTPREAYQTLNLRQTPLFPAWLALLLMATMIIAAWLREGRQS